MTCPRPLIALALALGLSTALAQTAGPALASPGASASAATGAMAVPGGGNPGGINLRAPITGTLPAPVPGNLPSPEPFPGGIPSSVIQPPVGSTDSGMATPGTPQPPGGVTYAPGVVVPGIATRSLGANGSSPTPPPGGYSVVDVAASFLAADIDGDGTLTREEAQLLPLRLQSFAAMDANGDGVITRAEYDDAMGVGVPRP